MSGDELFKQRLKFRVGRRTLGCLGISLQQGTCYYWNRFIYQRDVYVIDIKQYGIVGEL